MIKRVLAMVLVLIAFGAARSEARPPGGQSGRSPKRHEYRGLKHYRGGNYSPHHSQRSRHARSVAQRLAVLRANVHRAVARNDPRAAIGCLREIITLDPHDFQAYAFLSYSYAVIGDPSSAANVDIDTVAIFDATPGAQLVTSRACTRLSMWDPSGWRRMVTQRKAALRR